MEKLRIPADIRDYKNKKLAKKLIPCAVILLAVAAFLAIWGDMLFGGFGPGNQTTIYVALLIIPFAVTGVPFSCFGRTWIGTVVRVDRELSTAFQNKAVGTYSGMYTKESVVLDIRLDSGKIITRTVHESDANRSQKFEQYREGDRVLRLAGTKYLQVLPTAASQEIICVICGTENPIANKKCDLCGHTLRLTDERR